MSSMTHATHSAVAPCLLPSPPEGTIDDRSLHDRGGAGAKGLMGLLRTTFRRERPTVAAPSIDLRRPAPDALVISLQRTVDPADARFATLVDLLCRNARYWLETQASPMTPAVAAQLLRTLPPPAGQQQKHLWAICRGGQTIGCIDVVRQWPRHHTVTIGLLMIDERWQHQGIGQAALQALALRSHTWPGIRRWRVAVVGTQAGALAFWRRAGFADTGQRHHAPGQRAAQVVMEKIVTR